MIWQTWAEMAESTASESNQSFAFRGPADVSPPWNFQSAMSCSSAANSVTTRSTFSSRPICRAIFQTR
jgi:hypothetical protein